MTLLIKNAILMRRTILARAIGMPQKTPIRKLAQAAQALRPRRADQAEDMQAREARAATKAVIMVAEEAAATRQAAEVRQAMKVAAMKEAPLLNLRILPQ